MTLLIEGGIFMQESDFKWFLENYNELFKQFGEVYLAIKNKTVLGSYNSYAEGVLSTMKEEPLGSFIVQKCGRDESAYTNYISSMVFCD